MSELNPLAPKPALISGLSPIPLTEAGILMSSCISPGPPESTEQDVYV